MWELTNSPTLAAALAPASTAAFTLPTSPLHNTVIRPPPMGMVLTRFTLAALTIASLASTLPTYPLVSIIPNASPISYLMMDGGELIESEDRLVEWSCFDQFARCIRLEIARVSFIRVNVDFEFEALVHADQHFVESETASAADLKPHFAAGLHAVVASV